MKLRYSSVFMIWMAVLNLYAIDEVQWRNVGPGGGGWIQSMLASRHGGERFYVGCDVGGFYRSDDGGYSYKIYNTGFKDYFIECLAEHPSNPDIIYAGAKSGVYKSIDGGRHWSWNRKGFPTISKYSFSAMVSKIVIDQQNPEVVYAAIGQPRAERGGQGAIYKSQDGGELWQQIVQAGQLASDLNILDLAVNPLNAKYMLISTSEGVFASADGGVAWCASNEGLPAHHRTRRLAQSLTNPEIVYVSLKGKAGEQPWQAGVYRSENGGRTWQPRVKGLRQQSGKPGTSDMLCSWTDRLVVHPKNPDIVYAGGATWWDATVYKTTDGGLNWERIFAFGEKGNAEKAWIKMWGPSVKCFTISPGSPETVYFGTSGYIYRTDDGGKTWQQRYTRERKDGLISSSGLEVTCLHTVVPHPHVKDRVFFGFYDIGLLISQDGGVSFQRCMEGVPKAHENSCMTVAVSEDDTERVWAGFGQWASNSGGICESRDGGSTWKPLGGESRGMPDARPQCLVAMKDSAQGEHHLFYLASEKGIFRSDNNGVTWSACNTGLPVERITCFACDKERPGCFFAGVSSREEVSGAVYRSEDGCRTWQQVDTSAVRLANIRQIEAKNGRVYLTTRSVMVGKSYYIGGVFRSNDEGWKQVYTNRFCDALAIDAHNSDRVFVGLNDHPYHDCSTGGGVIMSDDGGESWHSLSNETLTCKQITWIAQDSFDAARFWLGTGGNAAFTGVIVK
ncbi:MAG: hypothetical protein WC340_03840 [Kiritimatiellia bacterium]